MRQILANKRRSDINEFGNIVTVLVGTEEERFVLHQDAVCAKSKFFKAACSKQWLEGQERIVRLPEAGAAIFQAYCSWIYSGELQELTCTAASDVADGIAECKSLIKLYLLGDSLDDIALRNQMNVVLFKAMENQKKLVENGLIRLVWESTVPKSSMRGMIVDVFVSRHSCAQFAERVSDFPTKFVQEVAVAAMEARKTSAWKLVAKRLPQYVETE